jgi:hypothetical protein
MVALFFTFSGHILYDFYTIMKHLILSLQARAVFVVLSAAWMLTSAPGVQALPQFSLMTGNKCLNCHINTQGSGLRNELGWYVERDMKLIDPKNVPLLNALYALDGESNSFADGKLTIGLDLRGQLTRSPQSEQATYRVIPMQFALHAAVQPAQWLTFEGMADIGAIVQSLSGRPLIYANQGQRAWSASVLIQPSYELPQLRIGHFQPSIGIRYDDHTMLVRQIAAGNPSSPLIGPNYAEYGAEINYDGLKWLTFTLGGYLPSTLSQMYTINQNGQRVPLLDAVPRDADFSQLVRSPSTLARVMLWPRTEDHAVNSFLGASLFTNTTFSLANVFAGVGLTDRLSLMGEYALSGVRDGRQTRNFSAELTYQPVVGLMPYLRYEQGRTRVSNPDAASGISEQSSTQITLGAQIFPLPYVELRPELRYFDSKLSDTESIKATRFFLQLHVFY